MSNSLHNVIAQAEQIILGKPRQIRLALACLLARGHLLIKPAKCEQDYLGACAGALTWISIPAHPVLAARPSVWIIDFKQASLYTGLQ